MVDQYGDDLARASFVMVFCQSDNLSFFTLYQAWLLGLFADKCFGVGSMFIYMPIAWKSA